jgi:CRP/FNR family cyclic AMP-dependent transcriptional regulator
MADDPFWSNLFKRKDSDEMALFEILSEIPIFQDFNTREFRKIEGILHRRSWGVGEAIVQEGNPGVGMYIIVSGDVKIEQTSDEGTTQTLAEL